MVQSTYTCPSSSKEGGEPSATLDPARRGTSERSFRREKFCSVMVSLDGRQLHLSLGGEWAYVSWTQLVTRQPKVDVPGEEPDLLPKLVCLGSSDVDLALVPSNCLLQMDVSWVPDTLTLPKPVVNSWNLRWLTWPGKQRRLKAEHALEWSEFGGRLSEGVLCVLGPGKVLVPTVLMVVAVCSQEVAYLLNIPLHLPIQLLMIARC